MSPTTPTADLPDRDNKETLFVKEEETNDADVFGETVAWKWWDVGLLKEPTSSVLLLLSTALPALLVPA